MPQKPSVRPGRPSFDRPTGAPHVGLPQNRRSSGMWASGTIARAGSWRGTGAISTNPAPSRGRATFVARFPVAREPVGALPENRKLFGPGAVTPDATIPHSSQ